MPTINATKDYYEILQLPSPWSDGAQSVSSKDIQKAYHRLALVYHPDKNHGNEVVAAEGFKKVQEAYELLSDEDKRQEYDRLRLQLLNAQAAPPDQHTWNFNFPTAKKAQTAGTKRQRGEEQHGNTPQGSQRKQQKNTAGKPDPGFAHAPPPRPRDGPPRARAPQPDTSPSPQEATPDLPENFDFSTFTFHHYYDGFFMETRFLGILRKLVSDGEHNVRKARTAVLVAKVNLDKFGAWYVAPEGILHHDLQLQQQEVNQIFWIEETERRGRWLKAHEKIARERKAEWKRITEERNRRDEEVQAWEAEAARKRVADEARVQAARMKLLAEGAKLRAEQAKAQAEMAKREQKPKLEEARMNAVHLARMPAMWEKAQEARARFAEEERAEAKIRAQKERDHVKKKARGGKVEVIEIEDSDDEFGTMFFD